MNRPTVGQSFSLPLDYGFLWGRPSACAGPLDPQASEAGPGQAFSLPGLLRAVAALLLAAACASGADPTLFFVEGGAVEERVHLAGGEACGGLRLSSASCNGKQKKPWGEAARRGLHRTLIVSEGVSPVASGVGWLVGRQSSIHPSAKSSCLLAACRRTSWPRRCGCLRRPSTTLLMRSAASRRTPLSGCRAASARHPGSR